MATQLYERIDFMREPRLLSETEVKEIEELLYNDDLKVNWRDGVLEDYFYTKELLSAKKREDCQDLRNLSESELRELEAKGKIRVSWRNDYDYIEPVGTPTPFYSSDFLLSFYNKRKNVLYGEIFALLQQYHELHISYLEKHNIIKTLDAKILNYRNTKNPFKKLKKLLITEQLLEEYKSIYALILKMIKIESQEFIQDILRENECDHNIIDEVKNRCYREGGSYLSRFL